MRRSGPRKPRPPLDEDKLNELMLAYVAAGRFEEADELLTAVLSHDGSDIEAMVSALLIVTLTSAGLWLPATDGSSRAEVDSR